MNLNTMTGHARRMTAHCAVLLLALFLCFPFSFHVSAAGVQDSPAPVCVETGAPSPVMANFSGSLNRFEPSDGTEISVSPYRAAACFAAAPVTMLTGTTLHTDLDLDALFGGVVDVILKMATYIGGALAASGVFQLLLSYYNDQPEGKAAALRIIVVGGALMGMRGLLELIGLIG